MKVVWMSADGTRATVMRGLLRTRVADVRETDRSQQCTGDARWHLNDEDHWSTWVYDVTGEPVGMSVAAALRRHKARGARVLAELQQAKAWHKATDLPVARLLR